MGGWDDIYKKEGDIFTKEKIPEMYSLVARHIPTLKANKVVDILDIGCGTGRHAIILAKLGYHVTAIDNSPAALEILKKKKGKVPIRALLADMAELPFADKSFDAAVCATVIHHAKLGKVEKTIAEIHRVLRPGGLLLIDILSTKNNRFGKGTELEPGTFIGAESRFGEKDVPHHYCDEAEVQELFSKFEFLELTEEDMNPPNGNYHWNMLLKKIAQ